ncbi:hypothetical protein Trydic_g7177 [Trypoxylus dichotomus]
MCSRRGVTRFSTQKQETINGSSHRRDRAPKRDGDICTCVDLCEEHLQDVCSMCAGHPRGCSVPSRRLTTNQGSSSLREMFAEQMAK